MTRSACWWDMPRVPVAVRRSPKSRINEPDLAARLRQVVSKSAPDVALPTTREFGKRFSIASATAYRMLQKLATTGKSGSTRRAGADCPRPRGP